MVFTFLLMDLYHVPPLILYHHPWLFLSTIQHLCHGNNKIIWLWVLFDYECSLVLSIYWTLTLGCWLTYLVLYMAEYWASSRLTIKFLYYTTLWVFLGPTTRVMTQPIPIYKRPNLSLMSLLLLDNPLRWQIQSLCF